MAESPVLYPSFASHSVMGDYISSKTKSDFRYIPYAVHIFPDRKSKTPSPDQAGVTNFDDYVSKCKAEKPITAGEVNSSECLPSHSLPSTVSKSSWDIHPSLKTLLGDLCPDFDVCEAVKNLCIEGFPNGSIDKEEDGSRLSSVLSRKLSICAPEFIPSLLNSKPVSSAGANPISGSNLLITEQTTAQITVAQSEVVSLSTEPAKGGQYQRDRCNFVSDSIPNSSPVELSTVNNDSSNCAEEQNLISFDDDFSLECSPISGDPLAAIDQRSVSSKVEQLHLAPYERSCKPIFEGKQENQSFKSFNAPSRASFHSIEYCYEDEAFQKPIEEVPRAQLEENYQVPAEAKQPSDCPVFKTYAEAANFYYSLLGEQTREKLFQGSLFQGSLTPQAQVPDSDHPSLSGLSDYEHTHDRPNWAAAPDEDKGSNELRQHPWRPNRSVSSVRSNASVVGEGPVGMLGDYTAHAPHDLGRNHYDGPIIHEPEPFFSRTNYCSGANDPYGFPRNTGRYSSHSLFDKGDRDGKSYGKKKHFPSPRPPVSIYNLEREIDGFYENLRAKANRTSQAQSGRPRNDSCPPSSSAGYDLEREIDGYYKNLRAKASQASQAQSARARNGGGSPNSRLGASKDRRDSFNRFAEEGYFDEPVNHGREVDNNDATWEHMAGNSLHLNYGLPDENGCNSTWEYE